MTHYPRVLIDARLAARGLGIATFVDRLIQGFKPAEQPVPDLWRTSAGWGPAAVAGTLARSGPFDISPRLDPRTRGYDVYHYACNLGPLKPGANSVITVHDLMHRRSRRFRSRLLGAMLDVSVTRAGRVVAVSELTRSELEGAVPGLAGRVQVIPHGMRRLAAGDSPRTHILAFGGAADPRKRTDLMVAAYRAYAESTPDPLPLVVLARAGLTEAQRTGLGEVGASIVPSASAGEVDRLMQRAAALLLTTKQEGFGLPLLEAAECATPVVIDEQARIADEVRGRHLIAVGGTGLGGWVAGIREAVERGPVAGGLDLPGWDQVARRYSEIYREVAER